MLLNDNDEKMILQILNNSVKTRVKLWAFGSRVNGKAHSGSDLDLVLCAKDEQPLVIDELMSFKDSLKESNLPFLVDVLDWNRIPDYFKSNIEKKYKVLKNYD
ncbi:Uncharacterized protein HI0073 [uncultured Candidatus Thioglobus sp.]|nr:Uncharacterized protein HI0073 [uncultured Candidatus Thioglobus sp.]